MHIPPFDNQNKAIVDAGDATVPLNYFNIVKLKKGEAFEYQVPGYETCVVPATGTVDAFYMAEVSGPRAADIADETSALTNPIYVDRTSGDVEVIGTGDWVHSSNRRSASAKVSRR